MKKVLWLTNIPSPYRVKFFNELGKKCELTVVCERISSDERDKSWGHINKDNYNLTVLGGKSIGVAESFAPQIVKYINNEYQHIVVTNYSDLTGIMAIAALKIRGIPYCIEGDGAFPGTGIGLKEYLKKWIVSGADMCFSTSNLHDKYYELYGGKNIIRYPFSSIYEKDIDDIPIDKESYRTRLGMKERKIILAVGQFIERKGYDVLIKASDYLGDDTGIYIVGGNPPQSYIELKETYNANKVHFIGFQTPENLIDYYRAADLFVHPTRKDIWGLVINEAMAHGLPVITTQNCIAGLELVTEENGIIVSPDNEEELANAIKTVFSMDYRSMGDHSKKTIRAFTIEKMTERHLEAWEI